MKSSKHITRPLHLYCNNTAYFLTASTLHHRKLLRDDHKTRLIRLIQATFTEYDWQLHEWVILDNHYHLLCQSKQGKDLPKIIRKIHSLSARFIKKDNNIEGRVWYNYWDYCPRNEKEYNTRLCYLLNNPYKHGYVEHLKDWEWSSFHKYSEKEALRSKFQKYSDYRTLNLFEDSF